MKEIKVKVYTAWEAIRPYITGEYLKQEWGDKLKSVDLTDDYSIAEFLEIVENDTGAVKLLLKSVDLTDDYSIAEFLEIVENDTGAVKLLTDEQKEVLGLNDLFDENHFYYIYK